MEYSQKKSSLKFLKSVNILLIVFLLSTSGLFAQGQKQIKPKLQDIPESIKRMEKLMGKWEGNVHSETGPIVTSKELRVSFDFSKMFKDLAVKVTTKFEVIDTPRVKEGTIIIGYDAADTQLHALMLNDNGEAYDLIGKWTNDYNLNFSCNTERRGNKIGITIWFGLKVPDEIGFKMYTSIGDNMLITDEGKLKRKKAEAAGVVKKTSVKK